MAIIIGAQVWQDDVLMGTVRGGRLPDMPPAPPPSIPIVADKPFIIIGILTPFREALENSWRNLHCLPGTWQLLLPDGGELNFDGLWGCSNVQWGGPFRLESENIWRVAAQFQATLAGQVYNLEHWFGNDPEFGIAYRLVTDISVVVGSPGQPPPETGALGIGVEIPPALTPGLGVEPKITVNAGPQAASGVEVHILHHQDFQFLGASVEAWDGPTDLGPMTFLTLGEMAPWEERTVYAAYRIPSPPQETTYSWFFSAHAADRPQSPVITRQTTVGGPETRGSIGGGVFNLQDEPLTGATVTVVELGRNATSDANGAFAFLDVPLGTYTVKATRPGYQPAQQMATVLAEFSPYVRFVLTPVAGPPGDGGQGIPVWAFVAGGLALVGGAILGTIAASQKEE